MCLGVEFLTINALLHAKAEQNVIGNLFCTKIILKKPKQTNFSIINILIIKGYRYKILFYLNYVSFYFIKR